jgi:hypothetical protein
VFLKKKNLNQQPNGTAEKSTPVTLLAYPKTLLHEVQINQKVLLTTNKNDSSSMKYIGNRGVKKIPYRSDTTISYEKNKHKSTNLFLYPIVNPFLRGSNEPKKKNPSK